MKCATCQSDTNHIVTDVNGNESCHICGGFSEASGKSTSGVLTRNSFRVRRQQDKALGDFTQPHIHNKTKRRLDINPDFVKQYPDKAGQFFSEAEMVKSGYRDLPKHAKKLKAQQAAAKAKELRSVTHEGSAEKRMAKVLDL